MFRGNNSNTAGPFFLEGHFPYPADVLNHPQLCENSPVEFHVDPVNYLGNNYGTPFLLPNKCGRDGEVIPRQQKLLFSLNNKTFLDESDRKATSLNINPVSTGLRLSYDDEERNSSLTSGGGTLTDIKRVLDQQKEELDHFIRTQEEIMVKGLKEIRQRHVSSLMTALEKGVTQKLREKDIELETITHKNKELVERMKQATTEAQNWCYMAKYNESVVNVLKTNLQHAMQRGQEGHGESDVDDAASCVDPNNYLSIAGGPGGSSAVKKDLICNACKEKKVSILLMPCRHFCLCKDCGGFASVCPVCHMVTSDSFEVYI